MGDQLVQSQTQYLDDLSNPSYSKRQDAVQHLESHVDTIVDQLIDIAVSDQHPQSAEALKLLRLCKDERRFDAFKQMISSDKATIGQAALFGVAMINPLPIAFLIESISKMHNLVSPHCVQLLGKHYNPEVSQLLLNHLQTTDEPVIKYTIINILGETNDTNMISIIQPYLTDNNHHVRSYAQSALNKLGVK